MQMPCVNTLSRWLVKGSIATVLITCASWSSVSAANDKFEGIPGEERVSSVMVPSLLTHTSTLPIPMLR